MVPFIAWKVFPFSGSQCIGSSSSVNGLLNSLSSGIQGLHNPTEPENPHSCFFVTGRGISIIACTCSGSTSHCPSIKINSK